MALPSTLHAIRPGTQNGLDNGFSSLLGAVVPEFDRDDIRELIVGSFRVMYLIQGGDCWIMHVVRGSRDVGKLLRPEDFEPPP